MKEKKEQERGMMGRKEEEGGRTNRKGEGEKKRRKNLERGGKAEGRQRDWLLVVAPSPGGHNYNPLLTKGSENIEKEKKRGKRQRIGEFAVRSCLPGTNQKLPLVLPMRPSNHELSKGDNEHAKLDKEKPLWPQP